MERTVKEVETSREEVERRESGGEVYGGQKWNGGGGLMEVNKLRVCKKQYEYTRTYKFYDKSVFV